MQRILRLLVTALWVWVCWVAVPTPAYAAGSATLKTPTAGDGSLSVTVNSYGEFTDALYDPVGSINQADTTASSWVALRMGTSGARTKLAGSANFAKVESNHAQSQFSQSGLDFQLEQTVEELKEGNRPSGSMLTQRYTIANPGSTALSFELVRYIDGDLGFDGSRSDGGGGNGKLLFETDTAGESSGATTFVGITGEGGTTPTTNRYEVEQYGTLRDEVNKGQALKNAIQGDSNRDGFVDSGYDVALALRNTFKLGAGESTTYVTRTRFGAGAVASQPSALPDSGVTSANTAVSIDVLANDFSPKDGPFIVGFDATSANGGQVAKVDNRLSYTPAADFVGTDGFNYTISAGGDEKKSSQVKITVLPALEAQTAKIDTAFSYTVPSAIAQFGTPIAKLADGSGLPSWLSFDASTGKFSGTPPEAAVGKVSLQVAVDDGRGTTVLFPWQVTVAGVCDTVARQNLVKNGGFETPVVDYVGFEESIDGWKASEGGAIEIEHEIGTPFEGSQYIELDANQVGKIYQALPTKAGKTYKLTFAFSPRPSVAENKLNVSWGDTSVAQLEKNGEDLSDTDWEVYTYDLKAKGNSTRLS
ncbi:MAG: putative Ig domain-containing protein, partial [Cyanobacteriota bacterium]|nr:putative Ig domain-containing protein [Cyanobacteriota bacterium]